MTARGAGLIAVAALIGAAPLAAEEALVTPVRVGRADAPLTLRVWAQQDYSHLAARPAIARVFHDVFLDWARTHPDVLSPQTMTLDTSISVRCEDSGVPWKIEARCLVMTISVASIGNS